MTEQAISAVTTSVPHRTWRTLGASLVPLALVVAALAVLLGSRQWDAWLERRPVQSTDDAQLRSDITQLSTKASGIVAEVAVDDYQRVKAGDLLVRLQDDDFRAQVALAQAAVVASEAALENLHSQKRLQASRVAEADANIGAASADLERARLERIRQEALENDRVSTHQRLEVAVAEHERLQATLASRKADLEAQRRQLAVLDTQEKQLAADVKAKEAALDVAKVNLGYTRIVAPTDGVLGERKVRAGQLVSAGTQVVSIVGDALWVIANFKETQVAEIRVGSSARISVDALSGSTWSGHVVSVSPAVGSQFTLLPPDNASGNYTRLTQRLPVKIAFDDPRTIGHLRAGMSAIASVTARP